MSNLELQLDKLKGAQKPWLFMIDWPDAVGANEDSVRAAIFSGESAKSGAEILITRDDGRFLQLAKIRNNWRVAAGNFVGNGSLIDSQIVRVGNGGQPILPKKGILRLVPGNNGAECTRPEVIEIGLYFLNNGRIPLGFSWWRGGNEA